jgi:pyrroloquinoline-quinone synthase
LRVAALGGDDGSMVAPVPFDPAPSALSERLLALMDRKDHWAHPHLTRPGLTREQLLVHFRHEYLVYVRDFPVLVARVLGQTPPLGDVRAALAENVFEEQTGQLSRTAPHPDLFLRMMDALGLPRDAFVDDDAWLHPAARRYKDYLWRMSADPPWERAAAVLTIFVEGSVHERAELAGTRRRPAPDEAVRRHALVVHYGCPPSAMELTRAHAAVEGDHRVAAWRMLMERVPGAGVRAEAVHDGVATALDLWLKYRDGVAERMGLARA